MDGVTPTPGIDLDPDIAFSRRDVVNEDGTPIESSGLPEEPEGFKRTGSGVTFIDYSSHGSTGGQAVPGAVEPQGDEPGAGDGDGDGDGGKQPSKEVKPDADNKGGKKEPTGDDPWKVAQAETDLLRQQIETNRGAPAPAAAPAAVKAPDEQLDALPDKPKLDDYDSTEKYTEALEGWYGLKAKHDARDVIEAANKTAGDTAQADARKVRADTFNRRAVANFQEAGKAQDFETVKTALTKGRSPWWESKLFGEGDKTPALNFVAKANPKGGEVILFLGRNPEMFNRLADLSGHPDLHPGHAKAWDTIGRTSTDPVSMLRFMASDKGQEWFETVSSLQPDLQLSAIGRMEGILQNAQNSGKPDATGGKQDGGKKPGAPSSAGAPETQTAGSDTGGDGPTGADKLNHLNPAFTNDDINNLVNARRLGALEAARKAPAEQTINNRERRS